jgi:hypothetical protein
MATTAEQIAELEIELTAIKSAMLKMVASFQSNSMDGVSVNRVAYNDLKTRRNEIEKKIARLTQGSGRMFGIDMSTMTPQV